MSPRGIDYYLMNGIAKPIDTLSREELLVVFREMKSMLASKDRTIRDLKELEALR